MTEPVAIVGMGCRLPGGADDVQSFWDLLAAGTDATSEVPADRWSQALFNDPDPETPGRIPVRRGGFLDQPVDCFDADFFGFTPREAGPLDPQQRLLLEVTWEAFEDAGIPPSSLAGANVGAYIGGFMVDSTHFQYAEDNPETVSSHTAAGSSPTMLSARLAHTFDWRGPCLPIEAACSSSLVALHYACSALANGECDLAVTGGVSLMLEPLTTMVTARGQFLAPDGRCKTFDHRANGYARGEGAGVLVLKPLSSAERDDDCIYAIIRGTAVNQGGRTPGITVPSETAQRAAILEACRRADVEPCSIGYFEAHGTGTPIGDPIEAKAIGSVLTGSPRKHWIGSVKTNIGHLEAAAGVVGVIKAALCLYHALIPPHLNLERLNPNIPFESLSLRVPTQLMAFGAGEHPRRAGVNSFGFDGTNAHTVLEQAPAPARRSPSIPGDQPQLLPLSARSPSALRALADTYATGFETHEGPSLREVCAVTALERDHHSLRTFVVAGNAASAARRLRALEIGGEHKKLSGGIAFIYTGMGPQWSNMGRELLREPFFAEVVADCDRFLARFGISIAEEFRREEARSRLTETVYAQLGNFVLQAGLTGLWRSWGFEPQVVAGHGVGELGAAYAAGVYSLEDALTIGVHRANLQARTAGRGALMSVALSAAELTPLLLDGVRIAAADSRTSTTLSGDRDALEKVAARLSATEVFTKMLQVEVAYHSHHIDELRVPLLAALRDICPRPATSPLFSTVTGGRVTGTEMDAAYWWDNVRQPAWFARTMGRLLEFAPGAVLEVGPHPVLAPAIREALAAARSEAVVLASQRRDRPGRQMLLETVGDLYAAGVAVDWKRLYPGPRVHVDLPKYPWQRERHRAESEASRPARVGTDGWRMAARVVDAPDATRETELSSESFPYLPDHRIEDTVIFPGAGYVEAALALFGDDSPCVLEDIVFHRSLVLEPLSVTTLRSVYSPGTRAVSVYSRHRGGPGAWTRHATLRKAGLTAKTPPAQRSKTQEMLTTSLIPLEHDTIYSRMASSGLNCGPAFRGLGRLWHRAETAEVFAEIDVNTVDTTGYRLHPALLDAAFQTMRAALLSDDVATAPFVPVRIAEVRFHRSPGRTLWVHGRLHPGATDARAEADLTLVTDDGAVVAEVIRLRAQALPTSDSGPDEDSGDLYYYRHVWQPAERPEPDTAERNWAVIGSSMMAD